VDSSGALLHRRGYREEAVHAPLARRWRRVSCCCSAGMARSLCLTHVRIGNLPIEAALLAGNRPPAASEFAFAIRPRYRPGLQALLAEAARGERESPAPYVGPIVTPLRWLQPAEMPSEPAFRARSTSLWANWNRHRPLGGSACCCVIRLTGSGWVARRTCVRSSVLSARSAGVRCRAGGWLSSPLPHFWPGPPVYLCGRLRR
jgi:hypothetical protein